MQIFATLRSRTIKVPLRDLLLFNVIEDPLISIVIVNYNGKKFLQNCILSVLKTNYSHFEVILVDNASIDASLDSIRDIIRANSKLKVVESEKNLGFGGGNNVGYSYSSGKYIVFLNNDTVVNPDWLTPLVNVLKNDQTIGLAQSIVLTIDGKKVQTGGWLYSDYLVLLHSIVKDESGDVTLKSVFEVPVASGTAMIIKRELISEIGLFDSSIFFYDDTLLSFKVWLANKRVVTVSNSRIRHIGGGSAWNSEFASYNFLRAKICLLFDVHYRFTDLTKALFVNSVSLLMNSFLVLQKKNFKPLIGTANAILWSIRHFGFLWKNRLTHWTKSKVSPDFLIRKFVRIKLPIALYFLPSKLCNDYFSIETARYERTIRKN
jgi:GT2 family glycosyltransferase